MCAETEHRTVQRVCKAITEDDFLASFPLNTPEPWYECSGCVGSRYPFVRNIAGAADTFSVPCRVPDNLNFNQRTQYFQHRRGPAVKCLIVADFFCRILFCKIGSPYSVSDREELLYCSLGRVLTSRGESTFLPDPYIIAADRAFVPGSIRAMVKCAQADFDMSGRPALERIAFNHMMDSARACSERAIAALRKFMRLGRASDGDLLSKDNGILYTKTAVVAYNLHRTLQLTSSRPSVWVRRIRKRIARGHEFPLVPMPALLPRSVVKQAAGLAAGAPDRFFASARVTAFDHSLARSPVSHSQAPAMDDSPSPVTLSSSSSSSSHPAASTSCDTAVQPLNAMPVRPRPRERIASISTVRPHRRRIKLPIALRPGEEAFLNALIRRIPSRSKINAVDVYEMVKRRDILMAAMYKVGHLLLVLNHGAAMWGCVRTAEGVVDLAYPSSTGIERGFTSLAYLDAQGLQLDEQSQTKMGIVSDDDDSVFHKRHATEQAIQRQLRGRFDPAIEAISPPSKRSRE